MFGANKILFKKVVNHSLVSKRFKNPDHHWSVLRKNIHPVDKALQHFDDFYKQVYGQNWESIRKALLGKQKYVAVINNYGNTESTIASLELGGALNVRTLFNLKKEYIQEMYTQNRNVNYLDKIWKQTRIEGYQMQGTTDLADLQNAKPKFSLEASLKTAEIDSSRIIDENAGFITHSLNEFVPATKIKGMDDYVLEGDHYRYYEKDANFQVRIEREYDIHFPEHLQVYCYEEDSENNFPPPMKGETDVLNYYLMDGGSLMPILALDLKPGCSMLDMCAAPGGKSFLAMQTLYPELLVCNDVSRSRTKRIHSVLEQFFYDIEGNWLQEGRVRITCADGRSQTEENYDRILVDAPCTTDRYSLHKNDNNIFKSTRIKERLTLPELQCDLLVHALKMVAKGGIVVYSTCSLSPIQNDGVVNMALKKLWEETKIDIVVKDLSIALSQVLNVYSIANPGLVKYGNLVLPSEGQNYGPTYFCKLQRIN